MVRSPMINRMMIVSFTERCHFTRSLILYSENSNVEPRLPQTSVSAGHPPCQDGYQYTPLFPPLLHTNQPSVSCIIPVCFPTFRPLIHLRLMRLPVPRVFLVFTRSLLYLEDYLLHSIVLSWLSTSVTLTAFFGSSQQPKSWVQNCYRCDQ